MPTPHCYPSDVSDDERAFRAEYLALVRDYAPQRKHDLRRVFDGLRARTCVPSRAPERRGATSPETSRPGRLSTSRPSGGSVPASSRRWRTTSAPSFGGSTDATPTRRRSSSTAERSSRRRRAGRAGYDGAKRRKGSKVHAAVDTLGHLLAVVVTPANEQDCTQIGSLCEAVQRVCGERVKVVFVDQGYTGQPAREAAETHLIRLEVVKHTEAKLGFVLLPRRWVVERSFGWAARFRRSAHDYERLPETLAGLHFLAFAALMLRQLANQCFVTPRLMGRGAAA